jgi:hypothetical protein
MPACGQTTPWTPSKVGGGILAASAFTKQAPGQEQTEQRVIGARQTITCRGCGKSIPLSPVFSLTRVTCTRCGQVIRLV